MRTYSSLFNDYEPTRVERAFEQQPNRDSEKRPYFLAIEQLSKLEDDWNGFGALSPEPAAVSTACRFFSIFPSNKKLPTLLSCGSDRSIVAEWKNNDGHPSLVLTFTPFTLGAMAIDGNGAMIDAGDYTFFDETTFIPPKLMAFLAQR